MKKLLLTSLILIIGLGIVGCGNSTPSSSSEEQFVPTNPLQEAFYGLKDNNFTLDYEDSYANNDGIIRRQKVNYTSYSIERSGDLGFFGIAQGDGLIFNYDIEDNQIVSGAPITNGNGIRYQNIYDYRSSFANFDFSLLSGETDEEGYYTYQFGNNLVNDTIFADSLLFSTYTTALDNSKIKIKLEPGMINIDVTRLVYDEENDIKDSVSLRIRNVGITQNALIKQYLDDGKSAKRPLDQKFYYFIAPYLSSYNYTSHLDASNFLDVETMQNSTYKLNQYFTESAVLYEDLTNNSFSGSILTQGVVASYTIPNKDSLDLTITSTPYASSDFDFYTSLYGGQVPFSFADIDYYDFVGYIDDENDNLYYFTNSYLIYMLSSLCFFEGNSTDRIITDCSLEILDEEEHRFKITFYSFNGDLQLDTGTYTAEFYDLNETEIKAVDKYLSLGSNPNEQTKEELEVMLNKFSTHNYSLDMLSNVGVGKYYYTPTYMYYETYGNPSQNYGYVKQGEAIYRFLANYDANNQLIGVEINTNSDYSSIMSLPGVGSMFGMSDDLGYVSALSSDIYNIDYYEISEMVGQTYWKNTAEGFSNLAINYIGYGDDYYPLGAGFTFTNNNDDSRISFLVGCLAKTGDVEGMVTFTFYDVGQTSYEALESYLNA